MAAVQEVLDVVGVDGIGEQVAWRQVEQILFDFNNITDDGRSCFAPQNRTFFVQDSRGKGEDDQEEGGSHCEARHDL